MKVIAIYSRKSIMTETGDSINNQIDMCMDYIKRTFNEEIEFRVYIDEGFSGGNTKRPRFQELLKDIKLKKFNALICYRLDRISRNVADFSTTLELLQANNVDFISIKEQFDTSTPMGRAMIYISSVFAQLERESIAMRVRDNMLQLAKTGRWLGGTPPLGFNSTKETILDDEFKERTMSRLTRNNEEMKLVKLIFDKYLETESINQVSKWFITNNIKGKLGGDLDKSAISLVLQNPAYVKSTNEVLTYLENDGYLVCGQANGNGFLRYAQNDEDNKIVAVAKHKGIIDTDKWLQVQNILKFNSFKAPNLGKTNTALLTGILKCGKCGANMTVKYGSVYKDNKKAFYYKCAKKTKTYGAKCNSSNINGDVAERILIESISSFNKADLLKELDILISNFKNTEQNESVNFKKEIQECEDKIKRLLNKLSLTDDIDLSKMIMDQIANYKNQIKNIKNEMDDEINKELDIVLTKKDLEEYMQKFNNLKYIFEKSTVDEKRKLLSELFEKIVWNEENQDLDLYYKLSKKK